VPPGAEALAWAAPGDEADAQHLVTSMKDGALRAKDNGRPVSMGAVLGGGVNLTSRGRDAAQLRWTYGAKCR
jgi:hypothetical protein